MPKLKSNKSARWRFKVTGTGKLMRRKAGKSHLLSSKSAKRRRNMRHDQLYAASARAGYIKRLLLVERKK